MENSERKHSKLYHTDEGRQYYDMINSAKDATKTKVLRNNSIKVDKPPGSTLKAYRDAKQLRKLQGFK